MNSTADPEEPRRNLHLLAWVVLTAAFVIASWSRLSLPFSASEAGFVHEALRASGQATSPDFGADQNPVPARVLVVIQQLVGSSERSLRLVFILLLAMAGWVFSELVPHPSLASAVTPLLAMLAMQFHGTSYLVRSGILAVLPASLALLAAPLAGRITNFRAILGLAGMLALGGLSLEAALAGGALLLGVAIVRGSLLERLTAVVTAAAGVAMGWVVHGPFQGSLSLHPVFPELSALVYGLDHTWPRWTALIIVLVSLLVGDGYLRHRLALLLGSILGGFLVTSLVRGHMTRDDLLAIAVTESVYALLLAFAANALGGLVRAAVVLALIAGIGVQFQNARPASRAALDVLDQARVVAQPGAALAIDGPDRVPIAVYVRLGHAPAMPLIYVPENTTLDGLAAVCRANQIRELWLHSPSKAVPAGFSAPESRPSGAPALMALLLEGR